mmetsp:Transcript_7568/g.26012  ORF Transcript_7568/g.26012 Transcript_7568/m.26012 type:complete len:278 (-) Transcript_7568:723-1556(-)
MDSAVIPPKTSVAAAIFSNFDPSPPAIPDAPGWPASFAILARSSALILLMASVAAFIMPGFMLSSGMPLILAIALRSSSFMFPIISAACFIMSGFSVIIFWTCCSIPAAAEVPAPAAAAAAPGPIPESLICWEIFDICLISSADMLLMASVAMRIMSGFTAFSGIPESFAIFTKSSSDMEAIFLTISASGGVGAAAASGISSTRGAVPLTCDPAAGAFTSSAVTSSTVTSSTFPAAASSSATSTTPTSSTLGSTTSSTLGSPSPALAFSSAEATPSS